MQFSIRHLMIAVVLVAFVFPITGWYASWRQGYVNRQFPEFRTLEQLQLLKNGDELSSVLPHIEGMQSVELEVAQAAFPNRQLLQGDEFYFVPVDPGTWCWMQFRDDRLVNHQLPSANLNSNVIWFGVPSPSWYIRSGHWLLYLTFLGVVFGIIYLWSRYNRHPESRDNKTMHTKPD
jgi:hypothetical protein